MIMFHDHVSSLASVLFRFRLRLQGTSSSTQCHVTAEPISNLAPVVEPTTYQIGA